MWTQKKIPKPLLVYFVAFFTYVTAGSFISQGCSPPNTCTPTATNMPVEIPDQLQENSPATDCVDWACIGWSPISLVGSQQLLQSGIAWRMRIDVTLENGTLYSSRVYNPINGTPNLNGGTTSPADAAAILNDRQISIVVPSCGKFTTTITVQPSTTGDCAGSGNGTATMSWYNISGALELTNSNPGLTYLLGDQLSNSYIDFWGLRPTI